MTKSKMYLLLMALVAAVALMGCAGDAGPPGADGADGIDYPGPLPAAYMAADGIAGGSVFDTWYSTLAGGLGTLADYSLGSADNDFVRCKACHAWDGLGNAASYASRSGLSTGNAGRPDVSSVNLRNTVRLATPQQLFDLIMGEGNRPLVNSATGNSNSHPDYTGLLTDTQVWNLVKAMRENWLNPNDLYDITVVGPPIYWDDVAGAAVAPTVTYATIGAGGNATNGDALLVSVGCTGCHGTDGKTIAFPGDGYFGIGQFLREKPNEVWYKMVFGQPGSAMPAGLVTTMSDVRDMYLALTNTTNFPD